MENLYWCGRRTHHDSWNSLSLCTRAGDVGLARRLGILATEFAWASRAIHKTKSIAASAAEKVGIPLWMKYLIAAVCTLISLVLIGYHFA